VKGVGGSDIENNEIHTVSVGCILHTKALFWCLQNDEIGKVKKLGKGFKKFNVILEYTTPMVYKGTWLNLNVLKGFGYHNIKQCVFHNRGGRGRGEGWDITTITFAFHETVPTYHMSLTRQNRSSLAPKHWSERVCAPSASFRHDGTPIIIDFWSERVRAPSASFRQDGTTIIIDFFSFLVFSFFLSTAITVLPERVVVGFPNFAWAPKKK
jgi:hypothetical protein